jgi:hypothetical protein
MPSCVLGVREHWAAEPVKVALGCKIDGRTARCRSAEELVPMRGALVCVAKECPCPDDNDFAPIDFSSSAHAAHPLA